MKSVARIVGTAALFAVKLTLPAVPVAAATVPLWHAPHAARIDASTRRALRTALDVEHAPARDHEEPPATASAPAPATASAPATATATTTATAKASGHAFDADAAKAGLRAGLASLPLCRKGELEGRGVAEVIWTPDGHVARVDVSQPFAGTGTGACIARRFAGADVPPFDGAPMGMQVRFEL